MKESEILDATDDELKDMLLTVDGVGKELKAQALLELMCRAAVFVKGLPE